MNVLFVIHTAKDRETALYKGHLSKKLFFEGQGDRVDLLTPEDFPRLSVGADGLIWQEEA